MATPETEDRLLGVGRAGTAAHVERIVRGWLCRRHHRAVHEEGFQAHREPDGTLGFRRPDGRPLPEVPPPAAVPPDPVEALRAHHRALGLALDARTALPLWLGEGLNVGWAIDVLHPLATGERRAGAVG